MHSGIRRVEAGAADELLNPAYWLVVGLEWQGDGVMAEPAVAIAPGTIPRDVVSHDTYQVLSCADLYARKHGQRVIFFSDLTRMFATAGTSWSQLGVDWEAALRELREGPFPAMYLTISEHAYLLICNPASQLMLLTPGQAEAAAQDERELVRQAITRQLASDWPSYMHGIIDAGRIRVAE
jgi:hypothetical protein